MLNGIKRVHFIGIGGYGMSALARILLHMGYRVTGSDLQPSRLTRSLEALGATVYPGHDPMNTAGAELAVYSTAIPGDNPELLACREQGIPVWHRSDLLARFINNRFGIAVAGTHGKTTTTSMVSLILEEAGLDPTALVGGEVINFSGNARYGKSPYLVAEACESDSSFLRYYPTVAIVTNIEADHLEFYDGDFLRLLESYKTFMAHIKPEGTLIYCADDERVQSLSRPHPGNKLSYALEGPADFQASELAAIKGCYRFQALEGGHWLGELELMVPGRHNVYNALAATALARLLGIGLEPIRTALARFQGAKRRFQVLGKARGVTVVDDYAHHPTEVKATLEAARGFSDGRVIAVFQPHRFTRLRYFMEDFARSFSQAHILVLHEVYSAGEPPVEGVSSGILAEKVREQASLPVHHLKAHREIHSLLFELAEEGDTVLFMGAGDISGAAWDFYKALAAGARD